MVDCFMSHITNSGFGDSLVSLLSLSQSQFVNSRGHDAVWANAPECSAIVKHREAETIVGCGECSLGIRTTITGNCASKTLSAIPDMSEK